MKKLGELTPVKAALIYSIALVLVVFCELPRVLSWMEETHGNLLRERRSKTLAQISSGSRNSPALRKRRIDPEANPPQPNRAWAQIRLQPAALIPRTSPHRLHCPNSTARPEWKPSPPQAALRPKKRGNSARNPKPRFRPHKVLLVGDSMIAEGFGPVLQRRLKKEASLDTVRKGQYSTGFVHQEDFNWVSVLKEFIREYKPDLIVIQMGANDSIDILDGSGKRLYCGNDPWKEVYGSRVRAFLKAVSEKRILSFWVGLPIMGSEKYSSKIRVINSVVEQECAKASGCVYLDSWTALADADGKYTAFAKGPEGIQIRIRAKDNVHLTEAGGAILTDYFLRAASGRVDLSAARGTDSDGSMQ